jgi:hypothetical protein
VKSNADQAVTSADRPTEPTPIECRGVLAERPREKASSRKPAGGTRKVR